MWGMTSCLLGRSVGGSLKMVMRLRRLPEYPFEKHLHLHGNCN
jgi:hypothetical protein